MHTSDYVLYQPEVVYDLDEAMSRRDRELCEKNNLNPFLGPELVFYPDALNRPSLLRDACGASACNCSLMFWLGADACYEIDEIDNYEIDDWDN